MEWINLVEICTPKQWKTVPQKDFTENGYPLYGANGQIGYYSEYTHENPTISITCRGATCGTVNMTEPYSYINGNAMALDDLNEDKVNIDYLYYYLIYRGFDDVVSGSAQPQITRTRLKNVKIPLIPMEKQLTIVNILNNTKNISQTRSYQFQELDLLQENLLLKIMANNDLENFKISDLLRQLVTGKSYAGDENSEYKVLKTSCVYSGHFDDTEWKYLPKDYIPKEEHIVKKGDIIVSRMNTSELVGVSGYVGKDYEDLAVPDRLWILKTKNNVNNIFLWKLMQTKYYRMQIDRISTGTSGSMKNISQKNFKNIVIPLPDIEVQNDFAQKIEEIEQIKEKMEESLDEMNTLFNALMQKAFTGELV